jgi:nucleotide-binding universal stress UspA family protein
MIQCILVGYNHSVGAQHAFAHALAVARRTRAHVVAVAVVPVPKTLLAADVDYSIERARERFVAIFEQLAARAREVGVRLTTELVAGYAAEQILLLAYQYQADLIVLGGLRGNPIRRWICGSVTRQVARRARCQTLLVH